MTQPRRPTTERCPVCRGRGTNTNGFLCVRCHGIGEVPTVEAPEPIQAQKTSK